MRSIYRVLTKVLLAVLLSTGAAPPSWAQAGRTMTADDCIAIRTVSDPRISPDGRLVAFVVTDADVKTNTRDSDIWVVSVDGSEPRRLTNGPKRDDSPQWAADSRHLAFISDRDGKAQTYVIDVHGGEAQQVTDVRTAVQSFAWSPDGKRIAYIAAEGVSEEREKEKKTGFDQVVLDAEDQYAGVGIADLPGVTLHQTLSAIRATTGGRFHPSELAWHSSGQYLCIAARPSPKLTDAQTTELYIVRLTPIITTQAIRMTQTARVKSNIAWPAGGKTLAFLSTTDRLPTIGPTRVITVGIDGLENVKTPNLDGTRIIEIGDPDGPVTYQIVPTVLPPNFDGYITRFEFSRDGKFIYFSADTGINRHLYRMTASGSQLEQLTDGDGLQGTFSLAQDAGRIAFLKEDATHPADVWVAEVAGDSNGKHRLSGIRQLTRMNPQVELLSLARTEVIHWNSSKDGREIEGLLVYPIEYEAGRRYPLVTSLHGGPEGVYQLGFLAGWAECPHVYAAHGYASFFPNFRGSSNYGYEFASANVGDLGGGDYQDIMSGVDYLIKRGIVDADWLAIKGYSYGGYMAGWIIGHTTSFKGAVFGAGLADAISYYSTADIQYQRETLHQGTPWRNNQNMIERSPVFYLQNARTPSLIYHGEKDERVPLGQSLETYMGLKQAGVTTQLVIYPREGHGLREPAHQLDKLRREMEWIEKYVKR